MNKVTIESMVARWTGSERPTFGKRALLDDCGCRCAQGDVLHCAGVDDDGLRAMNVYHADVQVALLLRISRSHAVLLRVVNDSENGCPEDVLANPERILGPQAKLILAFWKKAEAISSQDQCQLEKRVLGANSAWQEWHKELRLGIQGRELVSADCLSQICCGFHSVVSAVREILLGVDADKLLFLPLFGIHDIRELDEA